MRMVSISPLLPVMLRQLTICSDVTVPYPSAQRCEKFLLVSWLALMPICERKRVASIVEAQSRLQISHLYSLEVSFFIRERDRRSLIEYIRFETIAVQSVV